METKKLIKAGTHFQNTSPKIGNQYIHFKINATKIYSLQLYFWALNNQYIAIIKSLNIKIQ